MMTCAGCGKELDYRDKESLCPECVIIMCGDNPSWEDNEDERIKTVYSVGSEG